MALNRAARFRNVPSPSGWGPARVPPKGSRLAAGRPSSLAVMYPAVVARRDQVVDMHIPKRGHGARLVLAEKTLEPAHRRHLGAVKAKAARHPGKVASAVNRMLRVDSIGSELV